MIELFIALVTVAKYFKAKRYIQFNYLEEAFLKHKKYLLKNIDYQINKASLYIFNTVFICCF